jgi:hypothetical protein
VPEPEIPLAGGKLNVVVRVGDTVRRPAGSWTPTVHALLRHLRARGFSLGPEPLGFDYQGREVLSYLAGDTVGPAFPWPEWVWDEDLLGQVGRATARYHQAVADFRPSGPVAWHDGTSELRADQIVCHHDLAPYNVVVERGGLRGFIDWDLIGPGTIRSELAFVAWQWVPLHDPFVTRAFGWRTRPDRGRRLRILLDSYGLTDRAGFIDDVIVRVGRNRDLIERNAAAGIAAYVRLEQEGHVEGMNRAIIFLSQEGEDLQAQLT